MTAEEFCLRLAQDCAVPRSGHVLVAVSGGADSTALLCFFCAVRETYPLAVSCAHVEHGIRGDASVGDMAFVRGLCARLGVPFYGVHVDAPGYARAHGCGMEDAARTLRHAYLQKTARQVGADCVALAHHRGDQAETVLLHAARGCDVRGLGAMHMRRGNLIRPLLRETGESLRAYLAGIGQPWREDESNQCEDFARNRIRLRVMPELERACPGAQAALARLSHAARRDEDYFDGQIQALGLRVIPLLDGAAAPLAQLGGLHEALLSRVLSRVAQAAGIAALSARQTQAVMRAMEGQAQAVNLCGGAQARVGGRYLSLTRAYAPGASTALLPDGRTQTPFGPFFVRDARPGETGDGVRCQVIPQAALEGAVVDTRREGDVMIPFGQHAPVKVKKLMIDAGVERAMRRSVPLVRGAAGILWAVGLRPGAACAICPGERHKLVEFGGVWP